MSTQKVCDDIPAPKITVDRSDLWELGDILTVTGLSDRKREKRYVVRRLEADARIT